ncbi:MAG: tetratricopeptide repeat protein, partial [Candidatus Staskawiczbacteria bacterium]|nr:tetratricopeptide repeat protein [Candidatus Staskawiczbacteria bacterium]
DNKLTDQEVKDLGDVYDVVVPELEKFVRARQNDPQIYYVLPRIYRLGFQKLGKNDLEKAKLLLEKGFTYSSTRVEYYNEMALVLLTEGKFDEGEKLLKDYVNRMKPISFDYFAPWLMGNYYYVAGKYDLAAQDFLKAKDAGYDFTQNDGIYSRYIDVSDKTKNYQEIVDMSLKYIEYRGQHESPNADVYFNAALGYYYLGNKEKAKEFFEKTLKLNKDRYQQYESFFLR